MAMLQTGDLLQLVKNRFHECRIEQGTIQREGDLLGLV